MKYLKLFEEARIRWYNKGKWVEEIIEPVKDLYIILDNAKDYIVMELRDNDTAYPFNDKDKKYRYMRCNISDFDERKIDILFKNKYIWICNYNRKYPDLHNKMIDSDNNWVIFKYDELPEDIKNRLNCKCVI